MLNDKDYWDNRFKSGDWDNFSGREQTQFFYEIAINNLPKWIKNEINKNKWSICDLGCAEGDGTELIHEEFSKSNIAGVDFSQSAINKAKEFYPDISFFCSDICTFNIHFDIIFSSNTLEHFENPEKILNKMLSLSDKYLILLLPFQEKELHEEHFTSFNYNNFNLQLDDYQLLFYKEIDTENISKTYWLGKQILIIYGNTKNLEIENFTLEEFNNQYFDEYLHKIEENKTIKNELQTVEQEITSINEEKSILEEETAILKEKIMHIEKEKTNLELKINDLNFQKIAAKSDLKKNKIIAKKKDLLINDLLTNIQSTNRKIDTINSTKPYKLAYFIRRFSHEFIKGKWNNKKTFVKWIASKLTKRNNIQYNSKHNPLIQLKKFNANKIKGIKLEKQYSLPNFYEKIKFDSKKRQIDELLQNDYEFVTLFVLKCGWNMNLFQRPQHIALNFKKLGGLVLFRGAFDGVDRDMNKPIHKIENNLYLIDMDDKKLFEYLLKKLETVKKPKILHLYSTDNRISLDEIKKYEKSGFRVLYEYIDEISSEVSKIEIPYSTYKKHEYILHNADYYVVTSADKLYDAVHKVRGDKNLIMASNGVEYEHWDINIEASQLPKDIKEIVKKENPIIGYYGAIASWIDFDLIEKLLVEHPDYEVVFIGEIFNTKLSEDISNKYPNFHFLGPKNYYDLNIYAKCFDVCIIPFLINEITESTNPIKLFEYMALNKPIVTTELSECKKYDSVLMGVDHDDFIKKIDTALQMKNDQEYIDLLNKEALENTWISKTKGILGLLDIKTKERSEFLKIDNFSANQDILFFSIIDWSFRYQRPQHLAKNFADNGHRVFYFNTSFLNSTKLSKSKNVNVINLGNNSAYNVHDLENEIDAETLILQIESIILENCITDATIIVEYPTWQPVISYLKRKYGYKLVYDYLDEFEGFDRTNKNNSLFKWDNLLKYNSDLIITTSNYLNSKINNNKNSLMVRNGTEFKHFNKASFNTEKNKRPIIGYYGAIAEWFDSEIVAFAARENNEYEFVLIGDHTFGDISELDKLENIRLLGEKDYSDLIKYLKKFDVCLIPFNPSLDLIKATNPVKFYEYLSAGKKIIATDIPELREYKDKFVLLANDPQEFSDYIKMCVNDKDQLLPKEERIEFAKRNDWKERYSIMKKEIDKLYPLTSIIIITYNNLIYSKLCLKSVLEKTDYPNYEIIIVDNGSKDETIDYLKDISQKYENITCIFNKENLGFAKANNIGINASNGHYIVFLNNDTIVTKGWISGLIRNLESEDKIGIVGPVTNNISNEAKINVNYNLNEIDRFAYDYTTINFGKKFGIKVLAMFCVMLKREIIEEIGLLDENFEIGMFEDDDYSERIKAAGYKVICCRDVFIHHFGNMTFKLLGNEKYLEIFDKNKKIYEQKHNTKFEGHSIIENEF